MYVLVESMMNGTATLQIANRLIDKPTFDEAVQYVKDVMQKRGTIAEYENTTPDGWHFSVKQDPPSQPGEIVLGCACFLPRQPISTL